MIKVKPLLQFYIAASSLVLSGFIIGSDRNWIYALTAVWSCISGVYLIYRFNDYVDEEINFKFNLSSFLSDKRNLWMLIQFIVINVPLAFIILPKYYFLLFVTIGILGFMYSWVWTINGRAFRLKNVFLIKNILIGVLWGSLILLGAGEADSQAVIGLFAFATLQVFIGSSIRDLADIEVDKLDQVQTLPLVFGKKRAVQILQVINLFSVLVLFFLICVESLNIVILVTGVWRFINLIGMRKNDYSKLWTGTINLLTCSIILIVILGQHLWNI